jgi:hypothetical protein
MNKARLESMGTYTAYAFIGIIVYWQLVQFVAYTTYVPPQVHTYVHDVRTGINYDFVATVGTFDIYHAPITATALFVPLGIILLGAVIVFRVLLLIKLGAEKKEAAKAKVEDSVPDSIAAHGEQL